MFCIILKYFGISKGKDDYPKAVPPVLKKKYFKIFVYRDKQRIDKLRITKQQC